MEDTMSALASIPNRHLSVAALSAAFILSAGLAFAAGGGGGGGSSSGGGGSNGGGSSGGSGTGSAKSEDLTTCPKGEIWDIKKKRCVKMKADALPEDQMTEYAYALAKAQRYQEALDVLDLLHDPNTPEALNYRGYATRKLGRTDEGIGYYLKSVQLDPQYVKVREYLGEAYVIKGRVDLAKDQLQTIKTLCGNTNCEEYEDLDKAIQGQGGI
jgi:tetratricopeptide (TPR) repeat protein